MAKQQRKAGIRSLISSFVGRFVRRGFFRLVLVLFLLLFVLPLVALQILANKRTANWMVETIVGEIFDAERAEISWDSDQSSFTGPNLALSGVITYHNLKIARRAGATPHPEREALSYDFLTVPRVAISYDLKRLPSLPVTRIELPEGLELYFNIHQGDWLDSDLFREGEGVAEPPALPQIILGRAATVHLRADGILEAPEKLNEESLWYELVLRDLGLLPSASVRDAFSIAGFIEGGRFGNFELGGSVARRGGSVDLMFRSAEPLVFGREYAQALAQDVRLTVEQFSIDARNTTLNGRLRIQPNEDLRFEADLTAVDGTVCYVGFPLRADDVSADIRVENNNITVDATGRRGGAEIQVRAVVRNIGTDSEQVSVQVEIRDLLVDESFRLALLDGRQQPDNMDYATGLPYPPEVWQERRSELAVVRGYPEWDRPPPWRGGDLYPSLDPIFAFIARGFAPLGLADFELRFDSVVLGIDRDTRRRTVDETLHFKVFARDVTAAFYGLPEQGPGFPLPLHAAYGVVEGLTTTRGEPGRYEVRGYTPEELARLGRRAEGIEAHGARGLMGTLRSTSERVFVNAVYQEGRSGERNPRLTLRIETDGVTFDERIEQRVPPEVRQIIQPFSPTGRVDIEPGGQLVVEMEELGSDRISFAFVLQAQGAVAQYQLPGAATAAQFRDIRGRILIRSEGLPEGNVVELRDVSGQLLDSPIVISLNYRDGAVPSFRLSSLNFAVTPELKNILPQGVAEVLRQFEPRGAVNITIRGAVDESEAVRMSADISFIPQTGERTGRLNFSMFPYELTEVHGRLLIDVGPELVEVIVQGLEARGSRVPGTDRRAGIFVSGHILVPLSDDEDAEVTPIVDLNLRARDVPVDDALLRALTPIFREESEDPEPQLISFIRDLNVSGGVDVFGRMVVDEHGEMDWRFEIAFRETGFNFNMFPLPISGMRGSLIVDGTSVRMRNVVGQIEGGEITLHDAGFSEERGWWVSVSGRKLDFASEFMRDALPEALRNAVIALNPVGEFDLDLHLWGRDEAMGYRVALDVWGTDVDLGLHFDQMTARLDAEGLILDDLHSMNGLMHVKEVYFKNARFDDVSSSVQFIGNRLEFPNLRGRFYDGFVEGRFGMEGDDYSGEMLIRAADLGKLGRTAFPDAGELIGALDAEVRFHSRRDEQGQIGRGRIDVQPFDRRSDDPRRSTASLGPVPVFNAIFRVLGQEQNFDEGHVYFRLMPDRIIIRQLDVVSDSARVETFGGDEENHIMYDTTEMRMKLFYTLTPRSPVYVLQIAFDWLKKILMPFYVTGTLNEPRVEIFSRGMLDLAGEEDEFPRRSRGG